VKSILILKVSLNHQMKIPFEQELHFLKQHHIELVQDFHRLM